MAAPLTYYCFNRPDHVARTLTALAENHLADETDLSVYLDGPRSIEDVSAVYEVRELALSVSGFRSVTIRQSHRNLGSTTGALRGIRTTFSEHERAIFIDDDVLPSRHFLEFMNDGLELYGSDPRIFSISGFKPRQELPPRYTKDVFLFRRFGSWGWASWADRWVSLNFDEKELKRLSVDAEWQARLEEAGVGFTRRAVQLARSGGAWDYKAIVESAMQDVYSVYPRENMVMNIGFDGTGENAVAGESPFVYPFDPDFRPVLTADLQPDLEIAQSMRVHYVES